jgi:hypothetical protein
VNSHGEPFGEHLPRAALRPSLDIERPAFEPRLKEIVKVLRNERLNLLDRVQVGAEEDGQLVVLFREFETRSTVVDAVRPIGVRLLRNDEDR